LFTTVQDFNDIKIENVEDLKIKEIGGYCLDDLYKILGHSKDLEFLKNNEQEILPYIARRTKEALVLEK